MSNELVGRAPLKLVKFAINKIIRRKHIEYNKVKPPKLDDTWKTIGKIEKHQKDKNIIKLILDNGEMEVISIEEGIIQFKVANQITDIPETNAILLEQTKHPAIYARKKDGRIIIQQKSANSLLFNIQIDIEEGTFAIKDGFDIPLFYDSIPKYHPEKWFFSEKKAGIGCEHYFGFGEKGGSLKKKNEEISFWNTDSFAYNVKDLQLYQSQPIQIAVRENGFTYAIIYDNPNRSMIRIEEKESSCYSQYFVNGGGINYYVVLGPSVEGLFLKLSKLLGKTPFPPLSTLGHHQSRWSYYPEEEVRALAAEFRKRKIPCDYIHLDIDYMDGYRIFTFDNESFPDPKKLAEDLKNDGFKLVAITDPGIKIDPEYFMYKEGLKGKHFCLNPDNTPFEGSVWPEECHFPDFTQEKTRKWFGKHFSILTKNGIEGFWIDMNEPSIFSDIGTMPDDVIHPSDGKNLLHSEVHNLYGHLMAQATFEGLTKLLPNKRIFVLSRAAYLGTQRYAGTWTGDNTSEWSQLKVSLPMLMNMAISGQMMIGPDIGGFAGKANASLLIRWYQAACFFPFYRNHSIGKNCPQEPWIFGSKTENIIRKTIQQRYSFLPYIYTSIRKTCQTGLPSLKPLWVDFAKDPVVYIDEWADTEYLFGDSILVAPMLNRLGNKREVYLPRGNWYSLEGEEFTGGAAYSITVPLDYLPVYVKSGTILPYIDEAIQHIEQIYDSKINLRVYPEGNFAEGEIYLDDGESLDYQNGDYELVKITGEKKRGSWNFTVEREGKKKQYVNLGDITIFGEEKSNYLVFEK